MPVFDGNRSMNNKTFNAKWETCHGCFYYCNFHNPVVLSTIHTYGIATLRRPAHREEGVVVINHQGQCLLTRWGGGAAPSAAQQMSRGSGFTRANESYVWACPSSWLSNLVTLCRIFGSKLPIIIRFVGAYITF